MSSVVGGHKKFTQYSPVIHVDWGWEKGRGYYVGAYTLRSGVGRGSQRYYASESAARNAYRRCNTYAKAERRL